MYKYIRRHSRITIALLVLAGAAAYDLHPVYPGYKLLKQEDDRVLQRTPLINAEAPLLNNCLIPKKRQPGDSPDCLAKALPKLKSSLGLLAGLTKASEWLELHPEDKNTQNLALAAMDRLWGNYQREDKANFQQMDAGINLFYASRIFRAVEGVQEAHYGSQWHDALQRLEFEINDPALAKKQQERNS